MVQAAAARAPTERDPDRATSRASATLDALSRNRLKRFLNVKRSAARRYPWDRPRATEPRGVATHDQERRAPGPAPHRGRVLRSHPLAVRRMTPRSSSTWRPATGADRPAARRRLHRRRRRTRPDGRRRRGRGGTARASPVRSGSPAFQAWERVIHPDDLERVVAESDRAVELGVSFRTQYRAVRPDGSDRLDQRGLGADPRRPRRTPVLARTDARRDRARRGAVGPARGARAVRRARRADPGDRLRRHRRRVVDHHLREPADRVDPRRDARGVPGRRPTCGGGCCTPTTASARSTTYERGRDAGPAVLDGVPARSPPTAGSSGSRTARSCSPAPTARPRSSRA